MFRRHRKSWKVCGMNKPPVEDEIAERVSPSHKSVPLACRCCIFIVSYTGRELRKDLFSKWFSDSPVCEPVRETDRLVRCTALIKGAKLRELRLDEKSCSTPKENIVKGNIAQGNIAVPKNRRYSYYTAPYKFCSILLL